MTRKLFAELVTGSTLYGTAHVDSDLDLVRIEYPTRSDVTSNRQVKRPQCISNGVDTRHVLLGEFVNSLGVNTENTILAAHYINQFGELHPFFMVEQVPIHMFNVACNMMTYAKSPKILAHGYRIGAVAGYISRGEPIFPLTNPDISIYQSLRSLSDTALEPLTDDERIAFLPALPDDSVLPHNPINREALTEWVWAKYKEEIT